jgi:hypothetical protein
LEAEEGGVVGGAEANFQASIGFDGGVGILQGRMLERLQVGGFLKTHGEFEVSGCWVFRNERRADVEGLELLLGVESIGFDTRQIRSRSYHKFLARSQFSSRLLWLLLRLQFLKSLSYTPPRFPYCSRYKCSLGCSLLLAPPTPIPFRLAADNRSHLDSFLALHLIDIRLDV